MGKRQLAEQGGPESDLSSPSPSTTVVVPTYNEEEGIGTVLNKLFACTDGTYEVLVVDADSSDDTRAIASRFPCRIVVEPRRGKGIALKRGIEEASGENVIFIDADDTYPVEAIPAIASKLDNCDVVWTARIKGRENIPKFNRLGNAILSLMHTTLYGFPGSDPSSGLYGAKRCHLLAMKLRSIGFEIEQEIAAHVAGMKLRIVEMPIDYRPRKGVAKLSGLRHGGRHFLPILRLLPRYRPKTVAVIGLAALGLAMIAASRLKR